MTDQPSSWTEWSATVLGRLRHSLWLAFAMLLRTPSRVQSTLATVHGLPTLRLPTISSIQDLEFIDVQAKEDASTKLAFLEAELARLSAVLDSDGDDMNGGS